MKKRNQSVLKLNKHSISKLQLQKIEKDDLQNIIGGQDSSSGILISELDIL